MKQGFVKSSPVFFRLIRRSALSMTCALLVLAAFIPAPLRERADPALTPNPVKSAWFLLWIQELVGYARGLIYPVIALGCLFLLLPWLPGSARVHKASWFPREQRLLNIGTVVVCLAVVTLTLIALFFRGKNWSLTWHP